MFVFFFSSRRRHTRCALVLEFRRVLFRSQGTHGNHGNQGTHGNHGNHGGSGDYGHPGNMNTGGPASRGLVDVPGVVHQLGNSLFPVANGVQNALGGDGHAEHRNVPGPPAHANANATAGTQAPPAHANANANAHLRSEETTSEHQSLMRTSSAAS